MPGGTEFLPASPRGGEGTSALQGLEPLIFVHKVLGLAGALMLRCDLDQVVPSLKGFNCASTCLLCPSQRWHLGQLTDCYFFVSAVGLTTFPASWSQRARLMMTWTWPPRTHRYSRVQAASCMRERPGWGKVPSVPARLLILGAQGQLPSMSCVSCSLASREQWVEAGIGSCVNLSGYEAKEVPPCPLEKVERSFTFTP